MNSSSEMNANTNIGSDLENYGSESLNKMVQKLKSTNDERKRYEYILWMAKKLPPLSQEELNNEIKVKGCVSEVYVLGTLNSGRMQWKGYSDALITKGLLAFLIEGLQGLKPEQIIKINPDFIKATGLQTSLTPSRANGFLNIFLAMKSQAEIHPKTIFDKTF